MSIMTKRVAAAAQGPSMQREAKISWGLRISPVELEREYLQNDLRWEHCQAALSAANADACLPLAGFISSCRQFPQLNSLAD